MKVAQEKLEKPGEESFLRTVSGVLVRGKRNVLKQSPITVYKHDGCHGCRELLPLIKKLAKKRRIPVKVVDINKCHTKKCSELGYVPYIEWKNKEIKNSRELAAVLGVKRNGAQEKGRA